MLTAIFTRLAIDLGDFIIIPERRTMDLSYVRSAKFCPKNDWEGEGFVHNFLVSARRLSCCLPLPDLVDVMSPANIRFLPPKELYFDSPDDHRAIIHQSRSERASAPYHRRRQDEITDYDDLGYPDEQPPLRSLLPEAPVKKKKWYKFHKYGGMTIKNLMNFLKELSLEIRQLRKEMRSMSLRQTSQAHMPDPPPIHQRQRASIDGTLRTFERRRRQHGPHSTSCEDIRETQKQKSEKN